MSIIDRILSGDFDEENDSIKATAHPSTSIDASNQADAQVDPEDEEEDEEEEQEEEEDLEEEDLEEEDLEEDVSDSMAADADAPSEEYCANFMREHNLPMGKANRAFIGEAVTPKCSTFKSKEVKPAKADKTPKPKNSTTPVVDPTVKRGRGRPHKLTAHAVEVGRLYEEGVGTKALAEKFGVSVSCVINCLKVNNIQVRPKGRRRKST